AAAWACVLRLGRLCEYLHVPASVSRVWPVLFASTHLGQRASGPHPQGFYGQSRMVFLWVAKRGSPPVLRAGECHRRLVGQKSQPPENGAPDRETCGARPAGAAVLLASGGARTRSLRRERLALDGRRAARPERFRV